MIDFHTIFPCMERLNQPCALATIIRVEGSAYRKEGASMIIFENAKQVGTISGGCLEADLAEQAKAALSLEAPRMVTYDLRFEDDHGWGRGVGCNGSITVLIEPVTPVKRKLLVLVKKVLDAHTPVIAVTRFIHPLPSCHTAYYTTDGYLACSDSEQIKHAVHEDHLQQTLSSKHGCLFVPSDDGFFFYQFIAPKPRLLLFGAGPTARPLASLASKTGYTVIVLDWREALCNRDVLPDASECVVTSLDQLVSRVTYHEDDSVVIMTHQFQSDRHLLNQLLQTPIHYLGILGPRLRTARLLGSEGIPAHISSPIGLSIGAEGPEEIAISVMAEILQRRNRRQLWKDHVYGNHS